MVSDAGEFTQLLQRADQGDREAANQLFLLVQDQLKAIAQSRKDRLNNGTEVSVTGLVDEAFCRMVGQQVTSWEAGSRVKFFKYIAAKIHDILIDSARARAARKRGGDLRRVEGDVDILGAADRRPFDHAGLQIDLQSALERFGRFAERDATVFRLRYVLGCTFGEIANLLEISESSALRGFERARTWLRLQLRDYAHDA